MIATSDADTRAAYPPGRPDRKSASDEQVVMDGERVPRAGEHLAGGLRREPEELATAHLGRRHLPAPVVHRIGAAVGDVQDRCQDAPLLGLSGLVMPADAVHLLVH